MRKILILIGVLFVLSPTPGALAAEPAAPVEDASSLIAAVNQLRAANGLPPYKVNSILMSIAQSQSNYQASIGTVTHSGPGGTRPRDRAAAAGYGGGATIYVSENIAGGTNLSAAETVSWWQGDAPHLNTMLGAQYTDAGAGVAVAGDYVYYTLDVGAIAGSSGSTSSSPPSGSGAGTGSVPAVFPVRVATARASGEVIHVVQTGQTLIGIAAAYKVGLSEILDINGIAKDTFIYPEDKIVIRSAHTATLAPTTTSTATPPRPTPRPRATRSRATTLQLALAGTTQAGANADETGSLVAGESDVLSLDTDRGPLILGILAIAFTALMSPLIMTLRRKK